MRGTTTSGGGGGQTQDHQAPKYIVGNSLAGDTAFVCNFLDPGDGSGIAAALAAAAATPGDVWIRPGTYTRPAASTILVIPAGCTVRGSGLGTTFIVGSVGTAGTTQDVFSLGANAELSDLTISTPAGVNGGAFGSGIVQTLGATSRVRRVRIIFIGNGLHNTVFGITSGAGAYPGDVLIEDVRVDMPTVASTLAAPYFAMVFGTGGADSTGVVGPKIIGCKTTGSQVGIAMFSCNGGVIDDTEIVGLILSVGGSNGILYQLLTSALTLVDGPRITDVNINYSVTGDGVGATGACILISNAVTNAVVVLDGTVIDGFKLSYDTGGNLVSARQAIKLRIEQNGIGQLTRGVISDGTVRGHGTAVFVQTNTADATANRGLIQDWTIEGVVAPTPAAYGAFTVAGVELNVATGGIGNKIRRIDIESCDFALAPAGGSGVILGTNVQNTIVSSNELTPNGGTAITDGPSVTPQIIGNITT